MPLSISSHFHDADFRRAAPPPPLRSFRADFVSPIYAFDFTSAPTPRFSDAYAAFHAAARLTPFFADSTSRIIPPIRRICFQWQYQKFRQKAVFHCTGLRRYYGRRSVCFLGHQDISDITSAMIAGDSFEKH